MAKVSKTKSKSLQIVRHFFPKVVKVTDGDKPLVVEVTDADNRSALVKDHNACAMAVACKRLTKCDGVIVAVTTAYLVRGNEATRYRLPQSVSREVVSFDRKAGFAPGTYQLNAIPKTRRIGAVKEGGNTERKGGSIAKRFRHYTEGVRAALGSRRAPDGIVRSQ